MDIQANEEDSEEATTARQAKLQVILEAEHKTQTQIQTQAEADQPGLHTIDLM